MSVEAVQEHRETTLTEKTKITVSVVVILVGALGSWFFTMGSLRTSVTASIAESNSRFESRLDDLQLRVDTRLSGIEQGLAGLNATMQGVGASLQQIRLDMQRRTTTDQVRALLLQELQPVWRSIESLKAEMGRPRRTGK